MASRREQILLAVVLIQCAFAHPACHCFNSGTVSTEELCLVDSPRHIEDHYGWRGLGLAAQRLSLDEADHLDEHQKATLRRLSRFSATGSQGLSITPSEVERLHRTYIAAYSTPLGDTILEEGTLDYRNDVPDRSVSVDALAAAPLLLSRRPSNGGGRDESYVHPKTFKPTSHSMDGLHK